jgi:hypothetical protein
MGLDLHVDLKADDSFVIHQREGNFVCQS